MWEIILLKPSTKKNIFLLVSQISLILHLEQIGKYCFKVQNNILYQYFLQIFHKMLEWDNYLQRFSHYAEVLKSLLNHTNTNCIISTLRMFCLKKSWISQLILSQDIKSEVDFLNAVKTTNVKLRALYYLMLHVLCYGYKY